MTTCATPIAAEEPEVLSHQSSCTGAEDTRSSPRRLAVHRARYALRAWRWCRSRKRGYSQNTAVSNNRRHRYLSYPGLWLPGRPLPCEFSSHYTNARDGGFLGQTRLLTDNKGQYLGSLVNDFNYGLSAELKRFIYENKILDYAKSIFEHKELTVDGAIGIDSFICLYKGEFFFKNSLFINAKGTMIILRGSYFWLLLYSYTRNHVPTLYEVKKNIHWKK